MHRRRRCADSLENNVLAFTLRSIAIWSAVCLLTQEASAQTKLKTQSFCPVFTQTRVYYSNDFTVRYKGVKIRLSSHEAYLRWLRAPSAYLDVELLPQLKGFTLPERELQQEYCPVYRDRKVSGKDPFVWYQGKRIYLFDTSAVARWNFHPEKYADEEFLPQLRNPPSKEEEADAASTVGVTE